ncbi:MAG: aminotransferase class I/II-fold pyridoxal phosphate-dependent enzyme, partial [Minisyncoccia bacterium]
MNNKHPNIIEDLHDAYDWLKANHLEDDDLIVDQLPAPVMMVGDRETVSFCSNNYLGLTKRKEVLDAAKSALNKFGNGTCESRRLGGNLRILEQLEEKIANFKKSESSVVFATGLLANIGAIPSLVDSRRYCKQFYGKNIEDSGEEIILSDKRNHRSIQMGIKLSHAQVFNYAHSDMSDLERLLDLNKGKRVLI